MQTTEIKDFNWNGCSGISKVEGIDKFGLYMVMISKQNTVTGICQDTFYACERLTDVIELQANVYDANAEAEENGYVTNYVMYVQVLQPISAAMRSAIRRNAEDMLKGA